MISLITIPTSRFSIKNLMPYFQPPTRNPPLGFDNCRGGILMGSNGSPLHGSGKPPRGANEPSRGGGGPLSGGKPPSGSGPPSGEGFLGGGGGRFLVKGSANVFFDVL
jgi:hypothetical protein